MNDVPFQWITSIINSPSSYLIQPQLYTHSINQSRSERNEGAFNLVHFPIIFSSPSCNIWLIPTPFHVMMILKILVALFGPFHIFSSFAFNAITGIMVPNVVILAEAKLALPRCEVDKDCVPLCAGCSICICLHNMCVRGCEVDQRIKWETFH